MSSKYEFNKDDIKSRIKKVGNTYEIHYSVPVELQDTLDILIEQELGDDDIIVNDDVSEVVDGRIVGHVEVEFANEYDYEILFSKASQFDMLSKGIDLCAECTFISDLEKMVDLLEASMSEDSMQAYDDFLNSYSYLTQNELDDTIKQISGATLADLYRQAENAYIEELNGRPTGLAITSDIAKSVITQYVYKSGLLSAGDIKEFEECCESMAC